MGVHLFVSSPPGPADFYWCLRNEMFGQKIFVLPELLFLSPRGFIGRVGLMDTRAYPGPWFTVNLAYSKVWCRVNLTYCGPGS